MWRIIKQELFRRYADLAAAAGYLEQSKFTGMALGPVLGLGWRYEFTPVWAFHVGATGTGAFVKEGEAWTTRPEVGLELGVLAEF